MHLQESLKEQGPSRDASNDDIDASLSRYHCWNNNRHGENPVEIRKALQACMQNNFSVFPERLHHARLDGTSTEFNTQRVECLELDNLMETAYSTALSENFRTENRGAHSRFDFPDRDG